MQILDRFFRKRQCACDFMWRLLPLDSLLQNLLFWELLAVLIVAVMHRAGFILGDDQYYIDHICQGVPMGWHVVKSAGRCTPFTHVDLNVLLLLPGFFRPYFAKISYAINALLLCASAFIVLRMLIGVFRGLRGGGWFALVGVFCFVTAPRILMVHQWDVCPECRMIFLILTFLACFLRGEKTGNLLCFAGMLLTAGLMTMYKETSFLLTGVFAGTLALWGRTRISRKGWIACWSVVALDLAYLLAYYFAVYRFATAIYHAGRATPPGHAMAYYFAYVPLLLAVAGCILRGVRVVFCGSRDHLFHDAVLFSAVAFTLAYVKLGFEDMYYATPTMALLTIVSFYWIAALAKSGSSAVWGSGAASIFLIYSAIVVSEKVTGFNWVSPVAVVLLLPVAVAVSFLFARHCGHPWFVLSCAFGTLILAWNARECCEFWGGINSRRTKEMALARAIVKSPVIREVVYYLPKDWSEPRSYCENLKHYLNYAGWKGRMRVVTALPDAVASNQVLFVSRLYDEPPSFAKSVRNQSGHVELSWYDVVFGGGAHELR